MSDDEKSCFKCSNYIICYLQALLDDSKTVIFFGSFANVARVAVLCQFYAPKKEGQVPIE